jgi:hypothetical protein
VEQGEHAAGGEEAQGSTHRAHHTGPQPRRRRRVLREVRILVPLAAAVVACASTPSPRPPPVTPTAEQKPELPRSSIAAILLHREDLGLSPTQVETLVRRDDALAREDEALRARLASSSSSATPAPTPTPSPGGRAGRHGARRAPAQAHAPDPLTQLDDNDTRAYLEIEEQVLTEAQRPRAREIASAFREALYDQQHPSTTHGRADAGSPL